MIVIIDAAPALRDSLATELAARAIETAPRNNCPSTHVRVTRESAGISIAITDVVRRTDTRFVADLKTAASLVESWARPDLEATLLEHRSQPPIVARVDERETPVVLLREAPAPVPDGPPIRMAFDAGSSIAPTARYGSVSRDSRACAWVRRARCDDSGEPGHRGAR
jgi:hypothetical protein